MPTDQSPVTVFRPKSGRQPLRPIRSPNNIHPPPSDSTYQKPNLKNGWIEISEDSNKENPNHNEKRTLTSNPDQNPSPVSVVATAPLQIEEFEVSLADELSAIREKMERLRSDKEKTEKMLRERELMMEMKLKELVQREQIQRVLEIEVDRLYRLNELRSLCNRILPIKSLREKEQEKIKPDKSQGRKVEKIEEEKVRSLREKEQEKMKPEKSQVGKGKEMEEEKVTSSPCGVIEVI